MRFLFLSLMCLPVLIMAQQNSVAFVSGKVIDENAKPLSLVSVQMIGKQKGVITDKEGAFKIKIPANKIIALEFSSTGFFSVKKTFILNINEEEKITVILKKDAKELPTVTVTSDRDRRSSGVVVIDPTRSLVNPSPLNNIESLIKVFVVSGNELSSQYSVRGGSYDENLVYVNDYEIFRPFLTKSGQQEGLSFINPELTSSVKFYNGGFAAKYGDKLSSVLDIGYRKPKSNTGSAYISLLEQGFHIEGIAAKNKVTYLLGIRNRSNRNLLSSQQTKGNYIPTSNDVQALITYAPNPKWTMDIFGNVSQTKFTLIPEEAKLTSSVFTPLYTANIGLDIYFDGQEKDQYTTQFLGLSATYMPRKNVRLKWMMSVYNDNEKENVDITGSYLFGDRNFDNNSSTFGLITNPLGSGVFQNYSRNKLDITVFNATHKGSWDNSKHFLQWGSTIEQQKINDHLNEWEYNDSAGYSLPYNSSNFNLSKVSKGNAEINATRFSGYLQDNIRFKDSSDFVMEAGLRYNYNNLNNEFLLSPRLGFSMKPRSWKKNVVLKASVGMYQQPPFYREMRKSDGTVNTDLKAQKSWQASAGFDYSFAMFHRPARVTTELYYKNMWDVVPYDLDNVRIRYFGENRAVAYAGGIETRLYGELVKDAESWISLSFMKTGEKIDNFFYQRYFNKAGQEINGGTIDKVPFDSLKTDVGYVRRPTDRRISFGMFFQDYLSTNKNFKLYLNMLYGSNMPFSIPGSTKFRNAIVIEPYIRIDLGLSALLVDGAKSNRRSHNPFRKFESIWASFEVFNIIDRPNTISYLLIKDFQNNTFAMPNRLTPRLVNLKLVAKW